MSVHRNLPNLCLALFCNFIMINRIQGGSDLVFLWLRRSCRLIPLLTLPLGSATLSPGGLPVCSYNLFGENGDVNELFRSICTRILLNIANQPSRTSAFSTNLTEENNTTQHKPLYGYPKLSTDHLLNLVCFTFHCFPVTAVMSASSVCNDYIFLKASNSPFLCGS